MDVIVETAKTVATFGMDSLSNGHITELFKGKDGCCTEVLLTVTYPKCKKGYHAYKNRTMRFICVYGQIVMRAINLFTGETNIEMLNSENANLFRIIIPPNHAILLENLSDDRVGMIVSYPDPPYVPGTDEQFKLTYEEVMQIVKDKSWNEQKV